jgi:hypothetical protein
MLWIKTHEISPTYRHKRNSTWQHPVSFYVKLYGDVGNLELTAAFISHQCERERGRRKTMNLVKKQLSTEGGF